MVPNLSTSRSSSSESGPSASSTSGAYSIPTSITPMTNHYSITWLWFEHRLLHLNMEMLRTGIFSDVTIFCGQEEFKLHKSVLSKASPFFKKTFLGINTSNPFLHVMGINANAMRNVLQLMYLGQATVLTEDAEEFVEAADLFMLPVQQLRFVQGENEFQLESSSSQDVPIAPAQRGIADGGEGTWV